MDAVVQGGGLPWHEGGLDGSAFDAFDEWIPTAPLSLFEDLQATPAAWSSLDLVCDTTAVSDQKHRSLEPIACVAEPATYSDLKLQTTTSTLTAPSPTTANSYYFVTGHVCDDKSSLFVSQTSADATAPELWCQPARHSSLTSTLQTPTSLNAVPERSSQPPRKAPIPIEPDFQYQISQVHMYSSPCSPSITASILASPRDSISAQTQPASFSTPIQPTPLTVFSTSQFEFASEGIPVPKRGSATSNTIYSSLPARKPSISQDIYESPILSTSAMIQTPAEVQSCSFSATTPSTVASPKAQHPAKSKRKRDEYNLDNTCSEVAFKDKSGAVAAYSQVFGTARTIRQAYSEGQRKEIARTRKLGACERCKRFKMKCHRPDSPYELCLRCVTSSPQVLNMPCFLAKPIEAELFRDKPSIMHPLQTLRSEVYRLLDIEAPQHRFIKLRLTQDLGETLDVYVAKYEPRPNEKTSHPWKDRSGESRAMEMPPYCIACMRSVRQSMLNYITAFRGAFLSRLRMSCNEITGNIIDEARRYAAFKPESTVRKAIDLFAATRIIENDWRICGQHTLGINVVEDEENPWFGKIPVTPIMDTQLDQIVIQGFLKPLRDQLLQELQTKIYQSRRENWFEIFLTTSILLTNAELLLSHSRKNAKRYGANRRYNSLERAYKYFHTCNLLIAHFHFVCVGFAPLKLDWTSANASTMAVLDLDQVRFLRQLQDMIRQKEKHVLSLRAKRRYESELYWCHQLFFEKWKWEKLRIEDDVEEE